MKNIGAALFLIAAGIGHAGPFKYGIESVSGIVDNVNTPKSLSKAELQELKFRLRGIRKYEELHGEYVRGLAVDDIVVTRAVVACIEPFVNGANGNKVLTEYRSKVGLNKRSNKPVTI